MTIYLSSAGIAVFVLVFCAVLLVLSVGAAMMLKREGATWREILGWGWTE
jgi:hypothetical protein